jgi:hypothetical protein
MTDRETSRGAALLDEFLKSKGRGAAARCAEDLSVSAPTIHDWVSGVKRPKGPRREALEIWTGGAVPRDAWDLAGERAVLDTVKPFEPAPEGSTPDLPATDEDDARPGAA